MIARTCGEADVNQSLIYRTADDGLAHLQSISGNLSPNGSAQFAASIRAAYDDDHINADVREHDRWTATRAGRRPTFARHCRRYSSPDEHASRSPLELRNSLRFNRVDYYADKPESREARL